MPKEKGTLTVLAFLTPTSVGSFAFLLDIDPRDHEVKEEEVIKFSFLHCHSFLQLFLILLSEIGRSWETLADA